MSQKHVLLAVAELLGFHFVRLVWLCFQKLKWLLDGTYRRKRAARRPDNFGRSAQVLRVKRWLLFDPWSLYNSPRNLILSHHSFVHPSHVMRDEVSLYCLTEDEALFVEAPPGVEVWKKEYSAFHKIAQHQYAEYVISMPLESLYRLVDDMDEIQAQLIFVEFFPRCGSSLVCQLFEETNVCVTYNEPHVLNQYWGNDALGKDTQDTQLRTQAAVKMLCKPRLQSTTAFVFKMAHFYNNKVTPYLATSFPEAKFVYLYRNAIPNTLSSYKVAQQVNLMRLTSFMTIIPCFRRLNVVKMAEQIQCDLQGEVLEVLERADFHLGLCLYFIWAQNIRAYLREQSSGNYPSSPSIKYEHILANRRHNTQAMFSYCGLPEELVPKAMRAFEKDSQEGTILSREATNKHTNTSLFDSPEMQAHIAALCKALGMEVPDENFCLPNSLTSP